MVDWLHMHIQNRTHKEAFINTLNGVGKELCWGDGWGRSKECKMEGYSELAKLIPTA
jgi:hypothetical protein